MKSLKEIENIENILKEKGLDKTDLIRLFSSYYSVAMKKVKDKEKFEKEVESFISTYKNNRIDLKFISYLNKLRYV